MRHWTRGAAVLVAGGMLAGLAGPVPAAAAETGGFTVFSRGTQWGWRTYDAAAGDTVTVSTRGEGVDVSAGSQWIRLAPPSGRLLAPGEYPIADWPTATHAYVADGLCADRSGTLRIAGVTYTSGVVTSLSASYDVACAGQHVVHAALRYHSADDWWGVQTPAPESFGTTIRGANVRRTVTVRRTGSLPATFGTLTLREGSPFAVVSEDCSGATLALGGTCAVEVEFTPPHTGRDFSDHLVVPADAPTGSLSIRLQAAVDQPPPAPRDVRAVAGDDGIGVTWRAFTTAEFDQQVTAYRVYRDGGTTPVAELAPQARYTDPVPPGATHTYRVAAVAASGEGELSAEVAATVPPLTSDPGPVTLLWLDTPRSAWAGAVTPSGGAPGTVRVSSGNDAYLLLAPDSGAAWAPGATFPAFVSFGLPADGCSGRATVTVHEARVHANGSPVTLAASGALPCADGDGHFELRYAATTGVVAPLATPRLAEFEYVPPGTTSAAVPVTIRNHGTAPLVLGATTTSGPEWRVTGDGCAGVTVPGGGSCTLGARFAPAATGRQSGWLEVADNTPRGRRRVALLGIGGGRPSPPRAVAATGLTNRLLVTWSPPEFAYPEVHTYLIRRSTSATTGFVKVGEAGESSRMWIDRNRPPGQRFYYQVTAINDRGWSAPVVSGAAAATTRELIYAAGPAAGPAQLFSRGSGGAVGKWTHAPDATHTDPAISPDGRRLLHTREVAPGKFHLFDGSIDGGSDWDLDRDAADAPWTFRDPAWSPDGTRWAYSCKPLAQARFDLCVRGEAQNRVVIPFAAGAATPSWLPNGNELVVATANGIYVVAADGSYRAPITGTGNARSVAVSPDGQRIAWTRYDGVEGTPETGLTPRYSLRVSALGGGATRVLVGTGFAHEPSWSPDGTRIYYTHGVREADGTAGNRDVFSVAYTGGTPTRVTSTPTVDEDDVLQYHPGAVPPPRQAPRQLADFTGDGRAEIAVFRPATGTWLIRGVAQIRHGRLGDVPVPADYNGDRKADIAVFRPETGTWHIRGRAAVTYGRPGDVPVPADYDGDGRADIAVFRPSTGQWLVKDRFVTRFGRAGDVPVPADYNGDRKAEVAVYRPSAGGWLRPNRATVELDGVPAPADYSAAGRAQIAVYVPKTGQWWHEWLTWKPMAKVTPTANELPVFGNVDPARAGVEPGAYNPVLGLWRMAGQANVRYGRVGDVPV